MADKALTPAERAISQFRSKHKDVLTSLGQDTISRVRYWIPSGCAVFDGLMGGYYCRRGALAVGRIYEFISAESKGKSTLAEHFEASVQNMGGVAVRINSESAHDPVRAAMVGVDETQLIIVDTAMLEEGWDAIEEYPKILRGLKDEDNRPVYPLEAPILITWDTISSASPKAELEGDQYSQGMMIKPRINRMNFRRLSVFLAANNVTLLLLSQIVSGPKGEGSSGGYGIAHHTSVRVKFFGGNYVYRGGLACGIVTTADVIKNKVQPTKGWKQQFTIDYDTGINNPWSNFHFLKLAEYYLETEYYKSGNSCSICDREKLFYKKDDAKKKKPLPCPNCLYQPVTQSGSWYYINEWPEPGKRINFYSKDFDEIMLQYGLPLSEYMDECTYRTFEEMLGGQGIRSMPK